MTPDYFFTQLKLPSTWKYKGVNHSRDDDDNITAYGVVYDDQKSKIIRICFIVSSERCIIVERTRSTNGKGCNYKSVCNIRAEETERINEFILKRYIYEHN
jgi:hypothetical protein